MANTNRVPDVFSAMYDFYAFSLSLFQHTLDKFDSEICLDSLKLALHSALSPSNLYGFLEVSKSSDNHSLHFSENVSGNYEKDVKRKILQSAQSKVVAKKSVKEKPNAMLPMSKVSANSQSGLFVGDFQKDPEDFIGASQCLDTGKKMFSCKFCGLQGEKRANIKRHLLLKHIPEANEAFKCTICGKILSLKYSLKLHYMQSHGMPENVAKAAIAA